MAEASNGKQGLRLVDTRDTSPGEADVLAKLEVGDARAAAVLYDRYEAEVNRIVWHMLGADPDHDDVVHEVFLVVLRKARQVQDPEKLGGWIRAVTVNAVRQELRRRRVRQLFALKRPAGGAPATWSYDEEGAQTLRFLYGVLGEMSVEQQMLITLRHLQEYTLKETADLMGCSLATVKRKLGRAERRFRQLAAGEPGLRELARRLGDEGERR